jgi:hypothetical protein
MMMRETNRTPGCSFTIKKKTWGQTNEDGRKD